jgi:hypothetical protein
MLPFRARLAAIPRDAADATVSEVRNLAPAPLANARAGSISPPVFYFSCDTAFYSRNAAHRSG